MMKPLVALLQGLYPLSSATLLLPRPGGPYGTNVGVLGLVDSSRLDPFAPEPQNRSVVISVFYPTFPVEGCLWSVVPAFPTQSAAVFDAEVAFVGVPNGTFEAISIEFCPSQNGSVHDCAGQDLSETPVVLFSGGLGTSRLWYSALAQSVASFGFVVVTVDHPYDADVVEFPDGSIILGLNSTWDDENEVAKDVDVRAQDVIFVLDELSKPEVVEELFSDQNSSFPEKGLATSRVGVFGHSLGGATAAMAMFEDSRFVGGVNLDGGLYGPVIDQGLKNPFVLFAHKSNSTSETWPAIWPHLNWKLDIELVNSTHGTFTDLPLLAELAFGTPLPDLVQTIVGALPGSRARDVITAYVVAVMEMVLDCVPQALLQTPSAEFPEIEFVAAPART